MLKDIRSNGQNFFKIDCPYLAALNFQSNCYNNNEHFIAIPSPNCKYFQFYITATWSPRSSRCHSVLEILTEPNTIRSVRPSSSVSNLFRTIRTAPDFHRKYGAVNERMRNAPSMMRCGPRLELQCFDINFMHNFLRLHAYLFHLSITRSAYDAAQVTVKTHCCVIL